MAKFQVVVSDQATGKAKTYVLEGERAVPFLGKGIGDIIDGSVIGLSGLRIRITGGTDKDGFPMLPSVHGGVKKRIILSKGRGFKGLRKKGKRGRRGQRRAKMIRGRLITEDIYQINCVIHKTPDEEGKGPRAEVGRGQD